MPRPWATMLACALALTACQAGAGDEGGSDAAPGSRTVSHPAPGLILRQAPTKTVPAGESRDFELKGVNQERWDLVFHVKRRTVDPSGCIQEVKLNGSPLPGFLSADDGLYQVLDATTSIHRVTITAFKDGTCAGVVVSAHQPSYDVPALIDLDDHRSRSFFWGVLPPPDGAVLLWSHETCRVGSLGKAQFKVVDALAERSSLLVDDDQTINSGQASLPKPVGYASGRHAFSVWASGCRGRLTITNPAV